MSLRRGALGSVVAMAGVVGVAGAAAFACITPAVISLSPPSGRPFDAITVTGSAFRLPDDAPIPVQLRWGGVEGPVLAEVRPDVHGNFKTTMTIPDGPPGYYVVAAVLRDRSGENVPGTPGRALFQMQGAAPVPAPEPAATFTPASPSGSSFPLAAVTVLGLAGLVLFVAGFLAVSRGRRTSRAVPAPVRRD